MTILLGGTTRIALSGLHDGLARFQLAEMLARAAALVGVVETGPLPHDALPDGTGLPTFASWRQAALEGSGELAMIFARPYDARPAVTDAITAGFRTVVCFTEHVPVHDALEMRARARRHGAVLLGPNSVGVLSPGIAKAAFFTEDVCMAGRVGVLTKGGSLAYAVMAEMRDFGIGVSTVRPARATKVVRTFCQERFWRMKMAGQT